MKIFFALYSFLWTLAIPFLSRKKRLTIGLNQRLVKENYTISSDEKRILLYAASGGEAFLACTFLSKVKQENCSYYCFSWTKEGVDTFNAFAKKNPNIKIYTYFAPFDKPELIEKALRQILPNYCYIIETEIWFGLLKACKKLEIPFSFINARMTEKSYKNLSKLHFILKNLAPEKVYALSKDDGQRFVSLFSSKKNKIEMQVQENLKFEQARTLLEEDINLPQTIDNAVLLFASVREEEEKLLLPCIKKIQENFQDVCIIICPKHVERAQFWKENLANSLLVKEENITLASVQKHFEINKKLYIWNTFGDLKHLYFLADICFVGASLMPLGGQNFLEPLSFGTKTYVGQYLKNFSWVFEKSPDLRKSLLNEIASLEELCKEIYTDVENFDKEKASEEKAKRRESFKAWLKE